MQRRETKLGPGPGRDGRECGSAMVLSLCVLVLLFAFSLAHFALFHTNLRASVYFMARSDLRNYAESAIELAIHDVEHDVSGYQGDIGTAGWAPSHDVGRDGVAGTDDEGELDGIPTPGEPNTAPQPIGPSALGARFITHVAPTAYPNVLSVVATVFNRDATATVETTYRKYIVTIPKTAAVYVAPGVLLDLSGDDFLIDGNDTNPDGTAGPDDPLPGIATEIGDPPGTNQFDLLSQVGTEQYDQILGAAGSPSIAETSILDFDQIYAALRSAARTNLPAGTYTKPDIGDASAGDYRITHVDGDVTFSGEGIGAGILVVNGSLSVGGSFTFHGLVFVRGDVRVVGGGSGIHIWGGMMVGEYLSTEEDTTATKVTGTADLKYSSQELSRAQALLTNNVNYTMLYYDEH